MCAISHFWDSPRRLGRFYARFCDPDGFWYQNRPGTAVRTNVGKTNRLQNLFCSSVTISLMSIHPSNICFMVDSDVRDWWSWHLLPWCFCELPWIVIIRFITSYLPWALHELLIWNVLCREVLLRARLLPTATNSMFSPTGTRDSRQRTYPKPLNEHEFLSVSNSNPAPTSLSPTRSILDEIAVQLNLQENREELVRFWDKFTRKQIGLMASLRALGLSSCAIYSLLLIIKYWHRVNKGWISYSYWYHWLGCPAFLNGHIQPPLLVVLIYHSTKKYRLIVYIQSLSLQLYPYSGYSIMEENRCHTIWVKT